MTKIGKGKPRSVGNLLPWLVVLSMLGYYGYVWNETQQDRRASSVESGRQEDPNNQRDGWATIDVFYGSPNLLVPPSSGEWAAQVLQDRIVATLFRNQKNGYFVDLAANQAVALSNTYALEKKLQWRGLCVEPNPIYWHELSFRDCDVVAAVVGQTRMERIEFATSKTAWGGIVGFDNVKDPNQKVTPYYTVPFVEILEKKKAPTVIDYLSLDIEGAEYYVMQGFPFHQYQVKVMTVERPSHELQKLLTSQGYVLLKMLSYFGETLWVHRDWMGSLDIAGIEGLRQYPPLDLLDSILEAPKQA